MYDVILFDLDGTLTNPKAGITKSVQYALLKMGIKEDQLDKLTPFIGPPLIPSFKEFYKMNDEQALQAVQYYRERFSTIGLYENEVYEGIQDLLGHLTMQGKALFVATSKPTIFSVKILEHFQLNHFFTGIVGSNLDGTRVEKDEVIQFVLSEIKNIDRKKIVMVGDRKYDILGAQKNHIDAVGVGYGFGSADELRAAHPTYIADTIQELEKLLYCV